MSAFLHPPEAGLVSICVVAYRSAEVIATCVESCLAQTYPQIEVVVADDCSPDATLRALEPFGNRIQVVARARNGGCGASRNSAMYLARGEFIAWMDADDICHPDRIAVEVAALRAKPAAVLASTEFSAFTNPVADFDPRHSWGYYRALRRGGGIATLFPEAFELAAPEHTLSRAVPARIGDIYEAMLDGNFIHPPTILARRSAHDAAGPFDESWRYNHDYDISLRLLRHGPSIFVDMPLLRYRISPGQLSATAGERLPLETIRLLEQFRRDDPATAARNKGLLRRRIGESYMDVAEVLVDREPRAGLAAWGRAMRQGIDDERKWRLLAKALLPAPLVAAIRRRREIGRQAPKT